MLSVHLAIVNMRSGTGVRLQLINQIIDIIYQIGGVDEDGAWHLPDDFDDDDDREQPLSIHASNGVY